MTLSFLIWSHSHRWLHQTDRKQVLLWQRDVISPKSIYLEIWSLTCVSVTTKNNYLIRTAEAAHQSYWYSNQSSFLAQSAMCSHFPLFLLLSGYKISTFEENEWRYYHTARHSVLCIGSSIGGEVRGMDWPASNAWRGWCDPAQRSN